MIRGIIFDLGGVLIDNPNPEMMLYYAELLHVTKENFIKSFSLFNTDWSKGKLSEKVLWDKLAKNLHVPKPHGMSLWLDGYLPAFHKKEGVFSLVKKLKQKGYRTALLSNTEVPIMNFIRSQHWTDFDASIYSCEVGLVKPDVAIYNLTLQRLHLKPEETVMIDDRMTNIDGAKKIGMHTILFIDRDSLKQSMFQLGIKL